MVFQPAYHITEKNVCEVLFCKCAKFLLIIPPRYSTLSAYISSAYSCGTGLAQWTPVNHVRRGTEQH